MGEQAAAEWAPHSSEILDIIYLHVCFSLLKLMLDILYIVNSYLSIGGSFGTDFSNERATRGALISSTVIVLLVGKKPPILGEDGYSEDTSPLSS